MEDLDLYTKATTEELAEWLRDIRATRRKLGATATIEITIVPPNFMITLGIAKVSRVPLDARAIESELARRRGKAGA